MQNISKTNRCNLTCSGRSGRPSRRRGQALVEFALIVPVLLAMVLGIIEFGWIVKNTLAIANSTRDGARGAALGQPTTTIKTRIENEAKPTTVTDSQITLVKYAVGSNTTTALGDTTDGSGKSINDASTGQLVRVTVSVPHQQLTGFFPFLNGRADQAVVVMRRE